MINVGIWGLNIYFFHFYNAYLIDLHSESYQNST